MKKTALVLSGGAFHGAFQVGALKYLKENWAKLELGSPTMKFDLIAGVSVGSLNGLFVALEEFDELHDLWEQVGENGVEEIFTSDFIATKVDQQDLNPRLKLQVEWETIKRNFPKATKNLLLRALFNRPKIFDAFKTDFQHFQAIADPGPLKAKLQRFARRSNIKNCSYSCGYVSLINGKYYSTKHHDFISDEDFANGVLASATLPIIWPPIDTIATTTEESRKCVDGGIRDVSPMGDVIREISSDPDPAEYTLIIINCSAGVVDDSPDEDMNIAQIALRSLNITVNEIFNNDIKEFIDKNFILKQVLEKYPDEVIYDYDAANNRKGEPLKYFNSIIIQPDKDVLGDSLTANRPIIQKRIAHGEEKAISSVDKFLQVKTAKHFTVI